MEINPCYHPLLEDKNRYLILYGGAGSGKSVFAAQKVLLRLTSEPKHKFLVCMKVADKLESTVFFQFKLLIEEYGIEDEFKFTVKPLRIEHIPTGNLIVFAGLENPDLTLKSNPGITGIWIEEADNVELKDFNQLDLRLRGKKLLNYKQIILTFNPMSENCWLKNEFFDIEVENATILKTTYKDNAFIDDDYVKLLEKRISRSENDYRIYALGEWGQLDSGDNFYKSFKMSRHVKELQYSNELPLHVSLDFNIHPSVSVTIWQTIGNQLFCIDEIQLEYPHNTTKNICQEFKARYYDHQAGLYIYGDPAGRHQDTRSERGHNDFTIVCSELAKYHPQLRVPLKAPGVSIRAQFINGVFDMEYDSARILINPTCKKFIEDLQYLKQNPDGSKFKERVKNKSGITYEKYGHLSDTFDYFICEYMVAQFAKFQRGGVTFKPLYGKNTPSAKHRF